MVMVVMKIPIYVSLTLDVILKLSPILVIGRKLKMTILIGNEIELEHLLSILALQGIIHTALPKVRYTWLYLVLSQLR